MPVAEAEKDRVTVADWLQGEGLLPDVQTLAEPKLTDVGGT